MGGKNDIIGRKEKILALKIKNISEWKTSRKRLVVDSNQSERRKNIQQTRTQTFGTRQDEEWKFGTRRRWRGYSMRLERRLRGGRRVYAVTLHSGRSGLSRSRRAFVYICTLIPCQLGTEPRFFFSFSFVVYSFLLLAVRIFIHISLLTIVWWLKKLCWLFSGFSFFPSENFSLPAMNQINGKHGEIY